MKYWQKQRNYRKYENADGTVTCVITVDGQDVDVNAEVYKAYSQADRRERYQAEREEGLILSLDRLAEDEMQLSYLTDRHIESAEDTAIRNLLEEYLHEALALLSDEELDMVHAMYFEGMSFRELSEANGIPVMTLHGRMRKILEKMSKQYG